MKRMTTIFVALGLALTAPAAHAGARQDAKVIMNEDPKGLAFQEAWGYCESIKTGDTIYLSGVVAGTRPGETDFTRSYEQAFERIGVILQKAGASWDDVIDITTFHTDLGAQMPAIVAVKNKYVKPPFPAWTAIQVTRLVPDNGITEIKIVAKASK
jgi:enamine deaminase RidA (YjgF/YER057c/UK114 family)